MIDTDEAYRRVDRKNKRRDKKRKTKMVVDGAGIKQLDLQLRERARTRANDTIDADELTISGD